MTAGHVWRQVMCMLHGDDRGLVLPPRVAPVQVPPRAPRPDTEGVKAEASAPRRAGAGVLRVQGAGMARSHARVWPAARQLWRVWPAAMPASHSRPPAIPAQVLPCRWYSVTEPVKAGSLACLTARARGL